MAMYGRMTVMSSFRHDPAITTQKVRPGTVRRIATYARPYRTVLVLFLIASTGDAVVTVLNPLLLRVIVDKGIIPRDEDVVIAVAGAPGVPVAGPAGRPPAAAADPGGDATGRHAGLDDERALQRGRGDAGQAVDEATAHLDSESEAAVQRALRTALAGRTSLVIAHRLSTIREADQILVIDAGRVSQAGTHQELLTAGGRYADLYHTQFAGQQT
jgi:hypothetical protein